MDNWTSKTVLITGASDGIGAAIAKAFAARKASLGITGRDKTKLSIVGQQCTKLGATQVLEIVADLNNRDGIEKTFKDMFVTFKKLDVLVNNAGLWFEGDIESTNFDEFNQLFNVNVRAPVFLTQLCLPYLKESKSNVVNISSIDSQAHYTNALAYGMTKSAIDQFTKTAALDLSSKGIRVNAVNPGLCATNIFANRKLNVSVENHFATDATSHPLGKRNVRPCEIADAVLFLASDSAQMITGVCMNVDGGRVLTGQ